MQPVILSEESRPRLPLAFRGRGCGAHSASRTGVIRSDVCSLLLIGIWRRCQIRGARESWLELEMALLLTLKDIAVAGPDVKLLLAEVLEIPPGSR